jgi:hypothetical protein
LCGRDTEEKECKDLVRGARDCGKMYEEHSL